MCVFECVRAAYDVRWLSTFSPFVGDDGGDVRRTIEEWIEERRKLLLLLLLAS